MKLLSRTEEFILLAALYLKEEAYSVQIRRRLKDVTGKIWSYGALFIIFDLFPDRPFAGERRTKQAYLLRHSFGP